MLHDEHRRVIRCFVFSAALQSGEQNEQCARTVNYGKGEGGGSSRDLFYDCQDAVV